MENSLENLKKLKTIPHMIQQFHLGIYLKETHNKQKIPKISAPPRSLQHLQYLRHRNKCPLIEEWVKKLWKSYSAIKNVEILSFVTTWMDLTGTMLNEVCSEKEKYCMITHIGGT